MVWHFCHPIAMVLVGISADFAAMDKHTVWRVIVLYVVGLFVRTLPHRVGVYAMLMSATSSNAEYMMILTLPGKSARDLRSFCIQQKAAETKTIYVVGILVERNTSGKRYIGNTCG